ncbi:hypothetical protein T06_4578 [Trichinella sp. T6]|nr:hypothetical protein T06_4578 [Trichinella sp. T6]
MLRLRCGAGLPSRDLPDTSGICVPKFRWHSCKTGILSCRDGPEDFRPGLYKISSTGAAVDQPGVSYCVPRKFVPSAALICDTDEKTLIAQGSFNNFWVTGDVPPFNEEFSNQFREGVRRSSHLGKCLLPAEEGKLPEGSKSHPTVSRGYVKDICAHTSFH